MILHMISYSENLLAKEFTISNYIAIISIFLSTEPSVYFMDFFSHH